MKWEYLTAELDEYGNVRAAGGRSLGKQPVALMAFLSQVGEDGWELVTSIVTAQPRDTRQMTTPHYLFLFFKRPRGS
jgi:hypothetical protein